MLVGSYVVDCWLLLMLFVYLDLQVGCLSVKFWVFGMIVLPNCCV